MRSAASQRRLRPSRRRLAIAVDAPGHAQARRSVAARPMAVSPAAAAAPKTPTTRSRACTRTAFRRAGASEAASHSGPPRDSTPIGRPRQHSTATADRGETGSRATDRRSSLRAARGRRSPAVHRDPGQLVAGGGTVADRARIGGGMDAGAALGVGASPSADGRNSGRPPGS